MLLTSLVLMAAGAIYPGNFAQSVMPGDFPLNDGSMAAVVDFVVDAQGRPVRCDKVSVVGSEGLAKQTCPLLMHKHYKPAHRANGEPALFVTRDMVKAFEPGTTQADLVMRSRPAPQMELQMASLPDGKVSVIGVLLLDIDEAGKARDCTVPEQALPVGLCRRLDLLGQPVQKDSAGQPVGYITTLRVRLTVSPATLPNPAN